MTPGEKTRVRNFVKACRLFGWIPYAVDDGEELQRGKNRDDMRDSEIIDACDSVYESHILFKNHETGKRSRAWIINGNAPDGSEVVADCGVSLEEPFNRIFGN